jgi:hypothetical protein
MLLRTQYDDLRPIITLLTKGAAYQSVRVPIKPSDIFFGYDLIPFL